MTRQSPPRAPRSNKRKPKVFRHKDLAFRYADIVTLNICTAQARIGEKGEEFIYLDLRGATNPTYIQYEVRKELDKDYAKLLSNMEYT